MYTINTRFNNTMLRGNKLVLFITISLLVFAMSLLIQQQANADEVGSSASVGNTPPVASSVDIDSAATTVHLTENSTTDVTVTSTIVDNNSCEEITSVLVAFFRTDTGAGELDNFNSHYTVNAVSDGDCVAGGSDLTDTYTATLQVNFNADPTDAGSVNEATNWTAKVTPSDSETGTPDSDTIEMSTLTALNTTASIAYGTIGLGEDTGTDDQSVTVTNTGNEGIDVDLDGYGTADGDGLAMTCSVGDIPVGNERYSSTAGVEYSAKTSLTDGATELDLDVKQEVGDPSSENVYWGLGMPTQGVSGTCSGMIVFTANSDPNLD